MGLEFFSSPLLLFDFILYLFFIAESLVDGMVLLSYTSAVKSKLRMVTA